MSELFEIDSDFVERELVKSGHTVVVGCDEAGRGPLAGPVVAAAVVFRECELLYRCKDSKSLTQTKREELFSEIVESLDYAAVGIDALEIDAINIRIASLRAMTLAVQQLPFDANVVLVDGRDRLPGIPSSRAIIKGDALVATISAASIVAKVTRDKIMLKYHSQFPEYGFDRHFGYPTALHRAALKQYGPCEIHRRSYRGVRELLETL